MRRRVGGALTILVLLAPSVVATLASQPTPIEPLPRSAFRPVRVDPVIPEPPTPGPPVIVDYTRVAETKPPIDTPTVVPRVSVVSIPAVTGGNSIRGKASWYCKAGVSVCHHSYPPGSMVAAACGRLRRAMGPDWRGTKVSVQKLSGGQPVQVTLVDYCASESKTIDLYWEPMRRLGGTGTLDVVIRWPG